MAIEIHVIHSVAPGHQSEVMHLLNQLVTLVTTQGTKIMASLDALTAQVQANTTVTQGAVTLIAGLRQAIIDAGTDPVKLQALTDQMKADDDALAAAVATNPAGTAAANPA